MSFIGSGSSKGVHALAPAQKTAEMQGLAEKSHLKGQDSSNLPVALKMQFSWSLASQMWMRSSKASSGFLCPCYFVSHYGRSGVNLVLRGRKLPQGVHIEFSTDFSLVNQDQHLLSFPLMMLSKS